MISTRMASGTWYLIVALYGCRTYMINALSPSRLWGLTTTETGISKAQMILQLHHRQRLLNKPLRVHTTEHGSSHKSRLRAPPAIRGGTAGPGDGMATLGGISRREEQFERWATEAGIKAPKLRHAVFKDAMRGDLRGLVAAQATSKSERMVTVPAKAAITLKALESTPFGSWVPSDFWDSQKWYVKLALKLLWEQQLGAASSVERYVDMLPAQGSFQTLVHWTDQELDLLNYPTCADSAKRQRAAWDELHQNLVASCPDGAGRTVARDDIVWAMECVLSRAFCGGFGGGWNSVYISGGILAAACAAYAATEEVVWVILATLALLPLTLANLGLLGGAAFAGKENVGAGDYVLVPYVDSMNHVTSVNTDLAFSPITGEFSVSVDREYPAGEQAYISYGLKSNDELLQFYGFVESDCPSDTFVVAGEIATKMGIPEERMRYIKSTDVREALVDLVVSRGPEVIRKEALEGLRGLLLDPGARPGDGTVWAALRRVCEAELEYVRPSEFEGVQEITVREKLALRFRREKASVLEEVIKNLSVR